MTRRTWLLVSAWSFLAGAWELEAQVSREYDIKAVFILNFAQFVEWPEAVLQGNPTGAFVIGILGADPFGQTLDEVVRGERVRDHPVKVQRLRQLEDAAGCHILFIGRSETRRLPEILKSLTTRPVLTVSEIDDFPRRGGMIRLFTDRQKVRLQINNENARAVGLVISSKLLRVAEVIPSQAPE